jgi:hypothetical protein
MKKALLNIFFILIILSCGHHERKPVNPDEQTIGSKYYRLDSWLNHYGLELTDFTDSSSKWEEETITWDYDINADSNNLLKEFFIYSPDSTNCIDLDSYSLGVVKDSLGQLVLYGREVDTEVAMIDLKAKKKIRIWFCGTPCIAEEAQWIRNDLIYILGLTIDNNREYPTIWTFEKNNHISQGIKTKRPIKLSQKDYMQEVRLKKLYLNRDARIMWHDKNL